MDVFSLSTKKESDYAIVYTEGYINDVGGKQIDEECSTLLNKKIKKIIINFKDSNIITSIGISILIGLIEKVREKKSKIAFCNLTPLNSQTFKMMGLNKYAQIFDSEQEAINSL